MAINGVRSISDLFQEASRQLAQDRRVERGGPFDTSPPLCYPELNCWCPWPLWLVDTFEVGTEIQPILKNLKTFAKKGFGGPRLQNAA